MKKVMLLCLLLPVLVTAQKKEIKFQTFSNWQDVLKTAKEENKKIFIDAYATWCGPCKMMDADVYTDPKVSQFVDENFIAIKVQMDQVKNDPDNIKRWYSDAEKIQQTYKVNVMPTYLFIDGDAKLIYRSEGYQDAFSFLNILKTANDPNENYPDKLKKYKAGQLDGERLRLLALQAKRFHDDSLGIQIAKTYKETVIDQAKPGDILSPSLLEFLLAYGSLLHATDPIASYMYKNPEKADSLLNYKGYSNQMLEYLIATDILNPILIKGDKIIKDKPEWPLIENKVAKYFEKKTAKKILLSYKILWYQDQKDWKNYVKTSIKKQEVVGIDTTFMGKAALNNLVYFVILKYSNDPDDLNKGLEYMKIALKNRVDDDASLDTYANLLYKLGRKSEAIETEGRALTLAEQRKDVGNTKFYMETIQKMKNGLPIPIQ